MRIIKCEFRDENLAAVANAKLETQIEVIGKYKGDDGGGEFVLEDCRLAGSQPAK